MLNLADLKPVDPATAELSLADRRILSRHSHMLAEVGRQLRHYNLAQAAEGYDS